MLLLLMMMMMLWCYSPPLSNRSLFNALPPGSSIFGFIFQTRVPSNAMASSFTPSSLVFLGLLKADSHIACRTHAVPLILTCHAALVPCSDSAVSFLKVRVVAGNIRTASPTVLTDRLFCSVLLPLFTVVGMDRCKEAWYSYDNNLLGTPLGSRKKPNAGR